MPAKPRAWVVTWQGHAFERHEVRPAVAAFAAAMEERLKANDHKGGWRGCNVGYLLGKLDEEVCELIEALSLPDRLPELVREEAADVANLALFLADNFGGLMGEQR